MPEKRSTILTLLGSCPSKKNLWKRGKGSHTYIDSKTAAMIDSLTVQAKSQWRRDPVEHPDITVQFYVLAKRQDKDNMYTTIQDCLRDAGVLVNDNIAWCNGTLTLLPAVVVKQYERVVIGIMYDEQTRRTK